MNVKPTNQAVVSAAVAMLLPYVPELSPHNLIAAIKNFNTDNIAADLRRPMSRKEVAELLSVSLNTVNRYLNQGKLHRIRISAHTVRITPESLNELLGEAKGAINE
ncbi:MAG: helix-turn-helix domain-containing protein [Victivallaceae bacterium]